MNAIPKPGVAELLKWILRRRVRYQISGESMLPGLAPGDFVFVDRHAYVAARPTRGDIILIEHPYQPIEMVKRVSEVRDDGVVVTGDNQSASTDSRAFGRIPFERVLGRVTSRIA